MTDSGTVKLANAFFVPASINALPPIDVRLLVGSLTDSIFLQYANAPEPIVVMPSPITTFLIWSRKSFQG